MSERPKDLPDFDNPPVVEVVLGVQFATEKPIRATDPGLYWHIIRNEFPRIEEQPPLPPQVEELDAARPGSALGAIHFRAGPPPLRRCWFIDASGNRLIQVQEDRFLHNWRKETEEAYPRYESIRDEFLKRRSQFAQFVEQQGLGRLQVNQCELTYVNHLGEEIMAPGLPGEARVFTFWPEKGSTGFLHDPETVSWALDYLIPERRGRLHVELSPGIRTRDRARVVQLSLTARGPLRGEGDAELPDWFNAAREWIVRGFTDLTTPNACSLWKRKA